MDKRNTATWLRKREVANLMHVDPQTVSDYWKQGLLPGKQLFGGRIVIFKKSDILAYMEKHGIAQPEEEEHSVNGNHKEED